VRAALVALALAGATCAAPAVAQESSSPPAQAPPAPTPPNPIQTLDDCVSAHAAQLEVSGEAADVIAQAAVAECGRELTAAAQAAGGLRSNTAAREELKTSMRDSALVQIVELRAARKAPKPETAPAPAARPHGKKKPA